MTQLKNVFWFGLLIGFLGCAKVPNDEKPLDDGSSDGGSSDGGSSNDDSSDDEIDTENDPNNCGQKGNICVAKSEGACREGYCRCNANSDCHWPEECRTGSCQSQNKSGSICTFDDECNGTGFCIGGHCSEIVCLSEICDGFDNDCDGQIDEPEEADVACYTGKPSTLNVGICHAGIRKCFKGKNGPCLGEVFPREEIGRFACDRKDSDCDGCVDGKGGYFTSGCKQAPIPHVTFVFMFDTSPSMNKYLSAVEMLMKLFSKFRGNSHFDFALMDIAAENPPTFITVIQAATDFDTFLTALNTFTYGRNHHEPTYDAVYNLVTGVYDIELNLKSDSMPVIISIGNEEAQSVQVPTLDEHIVCEAVDARGALLSMIINPFYVESWDECASGFTFGISEDPDKMFMNLDSVLSLPCLDN